MNACILSRQHVHATDRHLNSVHLSVIHRNSNDRNEIHRNSSILQMLIGQHRFGRHPDRYQYSREIYNPFDTAHLETCGFFCVNGKGELPYHKNVAAPEGFEGRKFLRVHLVDVVVFLECGNHCCNSFDYIVFGLNWVKCAWTLTVQEPDPGGAGGYSSEFSVGVCRPVPQILTQFHSKTYHFPHPFSDLASKIHTRFHTFVLKGISLNIER